MAKAPTKRVKAAAAKGKSAVRRTTKKKTKVGPLGQTTPGATLNLEKVGKTTGQVYMVAAEADRFTVIIAGSPGEFFVKVDDPNYAAKVSTVLAAQGNGAVIAVKYSNFSNAKVPNAPREALAIAKGVHAIISGGSF